MRFGTKKFQHRYIAKMQNASLNPVMVDGETQLLMGLIRDLRVQACILHFENEEFSKHKAQARPLCLA